jgi:hypothetical protein
MDFEKIIPIELMQALIAECGGVQTPPCTIKRPKWDDVFEGYPKIVTLKNTNDLLDGKNTDDIPALEVFSSLFGKDYDQVLFGNACATRLSLGLIKAEMKLKPEFTIKYGDYKNKGIITSAINMKVWLSRKDVFGNPDVTIKEPNPKQIGDVIKELKDKKGIYIMLPYKKGDNAFERNFGASGHVTLWLGSDVIGGHNYIKYAKEVYFWELK